MASVQEVKEAFKLFHTTIRKREFSKSHFFAWWKERDMLPGLRLYLLGYFRQQVSPENLTKLIFSPSGKGYFDFKISDIAVEVAIRNPEDSKSKLLPSMNKTEIAKLKQYKGKSVLVLLDFSKKTLTSNDLDKYRQKFSLGRGPRRKYPYNILYYYPSKSKTEVIHMNISDVKRGPRQN